MYMCVYHWCIHPLTLAKRSDKQDDVGHNESSDSLWGWSINIGTTQRRSAWPLRKDDACEVRGASEFVGHRISSLPSPPALAPHIPCLETWAGSWLHGPGSAGSLRIDTRV